MYLVSNGASRYWLQVHSSRNSYQIVTNAIQRYDSATSTSLLESVPIYLLQLGRDTRCTLVVT